MCLNSYQRSAIFLALANAVAACGGGGGPTGPPTGDVVDVAGTWVGSISQPGGGIPGGFRYRMTLSQNKDRVRGSARAETLDTPPYFVEWQVRGAVDDMGRFAFEERRITRESPPPGFQWCLKRALLQFTDGPPEKLSGDYEASPAPCLPGTIDLERR